jgi:hypothetical protein
MTAAVKDRISKTLSVLTASLLSFGAFAMIMVKW